MKKTVALVVLFCLFIAIVPFSAIAEDEVCVVINVSGVNTQKNGNGTFVYTSDFGDSTGTSGSHFEITVAGNGKITDMNGKCNTRIPKSGFVLNVGADDKNNFKNINTGDYCIFNETAGTVTLVSSGYSPFKTETFVYDGFNMTRTENTLVIYRNKATTGTNTWGYEVCVDSTGTVISVGGNNNDIPEEGFVISAVGTKKQPLADAAALGMKVNIDTDNRTVTLEYTEKTAGDMFSYTLRDAENIYSEALNSLAVFDNEGAENNLKNLRFFADEAEKALNDKNIPVFISNEYAFKAEYKKLKYSVIPQVPVEQRTIWLRIPVSASESQVKSTVKQISDLGFNSVCIEGLFDNTTIFNVPKESLFEQNPAFGKKDMLKLYVDEFHKYGIEVTLWMSCYRVGYKGSSNTNRCVGVKRPEWCNTDQNGKIEVKNEYGDAYFLNPALPGVKEFLISTYKYILENYDIDGFQLDYIRYPENSTVNYGYDEYTVSLFKEKYGYDKAPTNSSQKGWNEWCEFRCSFVTDLVESVCKLIKDIRPDIYFSVDVAPDYSSSYSKMCQNTEEWIKKGIIDTVYPMAYGTTDAVKKWATATSALCEENNIYSVIGLRDNGAEIYSEQIVTARESGSAGTAFFSYSQYIVGDYPGVIENTVFANKALSPTYNAKKAVCAELNYLSNVLNKSSLDLQSVTDYSKKASELSDSVSSTGIKENKKDIEEFIKSGEGLTENIGDEHKNVSEVIKNSLNIIKYAYLNSKDEEKAEYALKTSEKGNDNSETPEEKPEESTETVLENTPFEKAVQAAFVAIMTIGLVGLPLFYYLNSRKKRLVSEAEDKTDEENKE